MFHPTDFADVLLNPVFENTDDDCKGWKPTINASYLEYCSLMQSGFPNMKSMDDILYTCDLETLYCMDTSDILPKDGSNLTAFKLIRIRGLEEELEREAAEAAASRVPQMSSAYGMHSPIMKPVKIEPDSTRSQDCSSDSIYDSEVDLSTAETAVSVTKALFDDEDFVSSTDEIVSSTTSSTMGSYQMFPSISITNPFMERIHSTIEDDMQPTSSE